MIRYLLVVSAVAAAALSVGAAPASAGCYGTTGTLVVCVDPTGPPLWSDCVHTGSSTCTPVDVPGPAVQCSGSLEPQIHAVDLGWDAFDCF